MDNNQKSTHNWFYRIPVRLKLLFASGLIFGITIIFSISMLDNFKKTILKDQFIISSKQTIHIIGNMLKQNMSGESLNEITRFDFVERITIIDTDEKLMYKWDSQDYDWHQLHYFNIEFPYDEDINNVSIAINRDKYMARNIITLSKFKNIALYIISLITLLILFVINLLFMSLTNRTYQ